MKLLKPWGAAGGGLLQLTMLLSLAGLRVDLDLDLYLLPPPALFPDELLPLGGPARPAHTPSPFPASGGWGRSGPLHPKALELDPAAPFEGHLLREVRALGVPFIPRTRVDAWLVHGVADGDRARTHGPLGAAASSAAGVGASVDGGSQAAPGGGGEPRAARSSTLAGEEEKAATDPAEQVPVAGGGASQENEILRGKCESMEEDEETAPAQEKSLQQQNNENENTTANKADHKVTETTESRNERHPNGTRDTSFYLEDLFQLLSSQPEYSLEGISLEDTSSFPGSINEGMNSSAHNVNFSHAVSHDVNLHEAMLLCPSNTCRRDPLAITLQQESLLQLNSQVLPGTNSTGLHPPVDNQIRNLTSQDLLYGLDANIFDEINLMSLAAERSFEPVEVQLFEEQGSDSGLKLNLSHSNTSITKCNSSYSACNEGTTGYTSDLENLSQHNLEGAVGGYCPQPSKHCHMDHRYEPSFQSDLFQHVCHNHTYHLQPPAPEATSGSFSRSGKSQKMNRYFNDTDRNLSRDEWRAKALHIPFSVEEIVRMPVDSFNSMLSRHYLTDLQISLMRDIRRRGKNKVAAQNCRRRKLDMILNLEDDVCNLQARKEMLKRQRTQYNKVINIMKQKLHALYCDIFSKLRDDQGRPVNPNQFILQCSHDGTVLIMPKEMISTGQKKETQKVKRKK
ncbi:nuclear factor erythroid 2-related factor 3 [Octodon degus]|uniref:Nuclear factor erythroid 2-related factor 3 n=1 Tax=Octodon degus TaxID=10160 RepID=A0A6P3EZM5_OCTDE|nr:nuclear factor erythroid 2-related factor 3 [Octodon degus]